jgi:hypothetical protein
VALMMIIPSLPFSEKIQPLFILVFLALPLSVGISFYVYFIRADILCIVTPTPTSILIELSKTDLFIKNKEILIPMSKIKSIKEDLMPDKNLTTFYSIHFIKNRTSIRLTQLKKTTKEELHEFSKSINLQVDNFNSDIAETTTNKNIVSKGSYADSWWAKVFTVIVYASILFFTLLWIFDSEDIQWGTALKFYLFCFFWLISFHNRKRK